MRPTPTDPTSYPLGKRIAELVDAIGSRQEAARIAGVSTQQLRNLISGRNAPSLEPIGRLAAAGGYRLDWVMWGEGDPRILRPWPEAMGVPTGLSPAEVFQLRKKIFEALEAVYAGTPWELNKSADKDDFLILDIIQEVVRFPKELRDEAISVMAAGHRLALERSRVK